MDKVRAQTVGSMVAQEPVLEGVVRTSLVESACSRFEQFRIY